jgi:cation transport ATPase
LKFADTGIAMGIRGADVALETADIVLMNDRLEQLPFLIRLSRKMSRTIKVNIWLSFGINFIAVIAGASGLLTPIWGAVTHNIGSILVVALAASIRFTTKETTDKRMKSAIREVKMKTKIGIDGMSCMHCAKNVKDKLNGIDGISSTVVNLEEKNAIIESKNPSYFR